MSSTRIDERFRPCLERHDLGSLERHGGSVYAVSADLRLVYVNPAWIRFAQDNGGGPGFSRRWSGLGTPVMPAISPVLRGFFEWEFRDCMQLGVSWTHEYECSSPTVFRRFRQVVRPLDDPRGLLLVNDLLEETPHHFRDDAPRDAGGAWDGAGGAIEQCAHCRRVRDPQAPGRWDWAPAWVAAPPRAIEFTLCGECAPRYSPARG